MVLIMIDLEKCTGDGVAFPFAMWRFMNLKNGSEKSAVVDQDQCIICRACEVECPETAITVFE